MPQLSPMNGLLIMFSVTLMLLIVLVINHFMLTPMASPLKTKKSWGEKLYY
uniref:ATPase subunit 8 n=1 Tax=Albinaria caerulea TaxID=42349 RepID=A6XDP3_ALBCA|nr:ATPase subunit 8 [Albinaria caerulea]ABG66600.1 ATPase subunit 8 [Albinaria caerulea]